MLEARTVVGWGASAKYPNPEPRQIANSRHLRELNGSIEPALNAEVDPATSAVPTL